MNSEYDIILEERTLLIDGDIIVYKPCCIFNDDDEHSRELIANNIRNKLIKLVEAAECTSYIIYVTTNTNFRNWITDDYKLNRVGVERPINLQFAKQFVIKDLGAEYIQYLEADDLLAINQKQDGSTVIWSEDKDLRQVPGLHLDNKTMDVISISELGELSIIPNKKPTKYYFTGYIGLMYQALVGDNSDYILGCAKRENTLVKSGKNKGTYRLRRVGISPGKAYNLFNVVKGNKYNSIEERKEAYRNVVARNYRLIHNDNWLIELEKQVNLLYMARDFDNGLITRWTYTGEKHKMSIEDGLIYTYENPNQE